MPTKKERLDALEADLRTLREELVEQTRRQDFFEHCLDQAARTAVDRQNTLTIRHDQAMEIVGTRIGELVERLDKIDQLLATPFWQANGDPLGNIRREGTAPFPTGAATTVDDALAAVPATDDPPRRGDRVRLEGAVAASSGRSIPDSWYNVVGDDRVSRDEFQIEARAADLGWQGIDTPAWLPWIRNNDPGLKEIRRASAAPTPRPAIEPEDGLDV